MTHLRRSILLLFVAGVAALSGCASTEERLMQAADAGSSDSVQRALRQGAQIDAKDENDGTTALIGAAINDNIDVVKVLIAHGANPFLKDDRNKTAREEANGSETRALLAAYETRYAQSHPSLSK
jgi:hypothetical protein